MLVFSVLFFYELILKIIMRIVLSAILILGLLNVYSQSNQLFFEETNKSFEFNNISFEQASVSSEISSVQIDEVNVKEKDFVSVRINEYGKTAIVGEPELPVLTKLIQIPEGAEIEIRNLTYEEEVVDLEQYQLKIKPVQTPVFKSEDPNKYPFELNTEVYEKDEYYVYEIISAEILGHLRNYRLAKITIHPVQYQPVKNKLKILKNIRFDVHFKNADLEKTKKINQIYQSKNFAIHKSKFENSSLLKQSEYITSYPIKYIIVSDPEFEEILQPFVEWKRQKGFIVIEAYTDDPNVGSTTGEIKAFLQSHYDNATVEDPAPTYGLIVGDVDQVPAFEGESAFHVTDLYYFEYTGDYFPDVYYGRWSANNTQELQPQIDKTLEYEKYLMEDPSFLNNALLVAGVDASYAPTYGNGQINYGTTYYFNSTHNLNAHTYLYPESGSSRYAILDDVNNGVTFANYTAHCSADGWDSPKFSRSDVDDMTNEGKYAMLIGNCCQSGMFGENTCFGEKILRAYNKGAIGYIGASNLSLWDEDYYFGVGVGPISANPTYEETGLGLYDRLFHTNDEAHEDWYTTNGQMLVSGNIAVTESNSGNILYYWEMYHLFGDPSLSIYLGEPADLEVNNLESVPVGLQFLEVATEPFTYVALTKDGVLIDAKETDQEGNLSLDISSIIEPGTYNLFAGKQNYKPYISEVTFIAADSPYIIMEEYIIKDANGGTKESVNIGETGVIDMVIKNVGSVNGENITLKIRTDDIYVQLIDSVEEELSIIAQNDQALNDVFAFEVKKDVPDQHQVIFTFIAFDTEDEWTSKFNVKLNAPDIKVDDLAVNDYVGGNENNTLDPGEVAYLSLNICNDGHYEFDESKVTVSSGSENLIIFGEEFNVELLSENQKYGIEFPLATKPNIGIGELVTVDFSIVSENIRVDTSINLKVGEQIESFETGNFSLFDWQEESNYNWLIKDSTYNDSDVVYPYSGNYFAQSAIVPAGQKSELNITIDVLLADSISFYKKVSSEDGGGNKYDYLEFFIDGNSQAYWDGEDDWSYHAYAVETGEHTFTWRYYKDGYVTEGFDMAWIDLVKLPVHESELTSDNNIPYLTMEPELIARQKEEYECIIAVDDADENDNPVVTLFQTPSFLTLKENDDNYTLSGTPSSDYYGEYDVILLVTDGKSFNHEHFTLDVKWPTGISNIKEELITIYPNPAQDYVKMHLQNSLDEAEFILVNSLGQVVVQDQLIGQEYLLNTSEIKQGVYFVKFKSGDTIFIKRLLITK